ncbi:hypothetical protein KY318_03740 [Candidatus Woesearchaeota archaeon]|nr:hypothetical protein [Candidatus Woesearchaeota archaeon]
MHARPLYSEIKATATKYIALVNHQQGLLDQGIDKQLQPWHNEYWVQLATLEDGTLEDLVERIEGLVLNHLDNRLVCESWHGIGSIEEYAHAVSLGLGPWWGALYPRMRGYRQHNQKVELLSTLIPSYHSLRKGIGYVLTRNLLGGVATGAALLGFGQLVLDLLHTGIKLIDPLSVSLICTASGLSAMYTTDMVDAIHQARAIDKAIEFVKEFTPVTHN